MAGGIDVFARQNLASNYISYDSQTIGTNLRLGFALTEEIAFQPRYTFYQQKITLPFQYNNCQFSNFAPATGLLPGTGVNPTVEASGLDTQVNVPYGCYADGEASLAVRKELAAGPVNVSLVGYTLSYNTLDNNKLPTSGLFAELRQDFAGVGGDVNFIRTSVEARTYYEVINDVVSVFKLQAGNISSWGGKELRMLDHFQMGPQLVRGFAPAGLGPRDLTPGTTNDPLGGSLYWGASVEAQTPLYFLPKDIGIKVAVFADAGSLWDYQGPTSWNVTGETLQVGLNSPSMIRSSVGVGLLWDSPLGPLRFDLAYPITKYCATPVRRRRGLRPHAGVPLQWRHQVLTLATPGRNDGSDSGRMNEPIFLRQSAGLTLDEIASVTGAAIASRSPRTGRIVNIAPLDRAGPRDLTFLESRNFAAAAATTHAGACLTTAALAKELPNHVSVLTVRRALSRVRYGGARIISARFAAVIFVQARRLRRSARRHRRAHGRWRRASNRVR